MCSLPVCRSRDLSQSEADHMIGGAVVVVRAVHGHIIVVVPLTLIRTRCVQCRASGAGDCESSVR